MEPLEQLSAFFHPIQPSIRKEEHTICYEETAPSKALQHFVYCYWQLKTREPLDQPFVYRVVSDGCIDIFFNHQKVAETFVMGFCKKYTEFPIGTTFDYIGIRFFPAVFSLLFNVDSKPLSNQSLPLWEVLPTLFGWIQHHLNEHLSYAKIVEQLNSHLYSILQDQSIATDSRFFEALQYILERKGHLEIESDLKTGLSPRQLRRIFNYYIGTSPKSFCKVIRFQYILRKQLEEASSTNSKYYYDVGYYDQAHFIKDFKAFYGRTPSEALK